MEACRPIACCLACGSPELAPVLDLGRQALANSYHSGPQQVPQGAAEAAQGAAVAAQPRFPLALVRCVRCFHCQLTHAVAPDLLYRHYVYVSGTTATLRDYFATFADRLERLLPPAPGGQARPAVLEAACNDGTLLEVLRARGYDTLGVDPARNLRELTRAKGLDVVCDYWGTEAAGRLGRKFDAVVAMNVLAHGPDPLDFLRACRACLAPGGRVLVQTSQAYMIDRGEFDTIYHEHHSFFCTRSMQRLAARAGLGVIAAEHVPVHGTSFLFTLAADLPEEPSVAAMLAEEERRGLYEPATYGRFADAAAQVRQRFADIVAAHRAGGFAAVGYGAAAKANTFLQFAAQGRQEGRQKDGGAALSALVDDNPLKQGTYAPGTDLPILAPAALAGIEAPVLHVVTAWNFRDEIVRRIRAVRDRGDDRFVAYFPDVELFR